MYYGARKRPSTLVGCTKRSSLPAGLVIYIPLPERLALLLPVDDEDRHQAADECEHQQHLDPRRPDLVDCVGVRVRARHHGVTVVSPLGAADGEHEQQDQADPEPAPGAYFLGSGVVSAVVGLLVGFAHVDLLDQLRAMLRMVSFGWYMGTPTSTQPSDGEMN